MERIRKIEMFAVIVIVVLTFVVIAEMLIYRIPPSTTATGLLVFGWVCMIMTNQFWKGIWKNK